MSIFAKMDCLEEAIFNQMFAFKHSLFCCNGQEATEIWYLNA